MLDNGGVEPGESVLSRRTIWNLRFDVIDSSKPRNTSLYSSKYFPRMTTAPMTRHTYLPEPHSMALSALTAEIEKGVIKIPQFQRDFVWKKQKSAELIDSILKGYPIGTFIFWKTKEELRSIRNIGGLELPTSPKGDFIQYVLDGQQRLTSLFAAIKGLSIGRADGTKEDFSTFFVDLEADSDEPLVLAELDDESKKHRWIKLNDLLFGKIKQLSQYPEDAQEVIQAYKDRLNAYQFPIVTLKEAPIEVATEVFTRLNVSGKDLSMFEIMVAKTYDAERQFDLAEKYDELITKLKQARYGTLPSAAVLQAVSACISKETKKKAILAINKTKIVDEWDRIAKALAKAVDYLRNSVGVPVSQLLPYPALIVPFTYYFYREKHNPDAKRSQLLQEFFWRVGLGERYSGSLDTKLAQDIKRMDVIIDGKRPVYDWDVDTSVEYLRRNGGFSTGKAYIKTILCLMATKRPLSFRDNGVVNISNDWLARSNSKNYHHFFPKSFLRKQGFDSKFANHIVNITLVDDQLNKREIGAKPPSKYVAKYAKDNAKLKKALSTHMINLNTFGIQEDDYEKFFARRAAKLSRELEKKIGIAGDSEKADDE